MANVAGKEIFSEMMSCLDSMHNSVPNVAKLRELKELKSQFKSYNQQNTGLRILSIDIDMAKSLTDR